MGNTIIYKVKAKTTKEGTSKFLRKWFDDLERCSNQVLVFNDDEIQVEGSSSYRYEKEILQNVFSWLMENSQEAEGSVIDAINGGHKWIVKEGKVVSEEVIELEYDELPLVGSSSPESFSSFGSIDDAFNSLLDLDKD